MQLMQSADGKTLLYKQFRLTRVGLEFSGTLTLDDWKAAGRLLGHIEKSRNWWIGDWINAYEAGWGEMYNLAQEMTRMDKGTLMNIASVCSRVEISRRNDHLSFTHHTLVAPLPPPKQTYWLNRAKEDQLSVAQLRHAIETKQDEPAPKSGTVVERSPLAHKAHFAVYRRLFRGVEIGDPQKVSVEDCDRVIEWATRVKEFRLEYEQQLAEKGDQS
jgi:hypothetical protein